MKIGFLGAGKMATAIAGGIIKSGMVDREEIIACDISAAARQAFEQATGIPCEASQSCLAQASVLVIAVKPQGAKAAVTALPALPAGALVISIAAGISLASLGDWLQSGCVIRVMPNTPLLVEKGATVFAAGPAVTEAQKQLTARIFGSLGLVREIHETCIDAVTALSGSGPAYVFAFVEALTAAGQAAGLPADLASELTIQTLAGASAMLSEGVGSASELRRAVTSAGGTTAAGLAVLEQAGFARTLHEGVIAARDRSIELGRLD